MLPPDSLASAVYTVGETTTETFSSFAESLPSGLLRAKGFVRLNGDVHLFSWVMGKADLRRVISREIPETILGHLVFIGPPDALQRLSAVWGNDPIALGKS